MNSHHRDFDASAQFFIGLMSGTSCDGVDAVLLAIEAGERPRWEILGHRQDAYDRDLRLRLLALPEARSPEICELHLELAEFWSEVVARLLEESAVGASAIEAIGSHGHTCFHHSPPREPRASTLQIGDASLIARRTGIVTVAEFRGADIAEGGQGAPLVPAADAILFAEHIDSGLLLLNIGGIANLTSLGTSRLAFDAGPGCMIIDNLAFRASGGTEFFDRDALRARRGLVLNTVLGEWLDAAFFSLPPPRTSGREDFGQAFVESTVSRHPDASWEDLLRTAVELTAVSVENAIRKWIEPAATCRERRDPEKEDLEMRNREPEDRGSEDCEPSDREMWVAGGGAENPLLMERLRHHVFGWRIHRMSERCALGCDQREAAAFAILARECLAGRPGNWPEATGARRAVRLGVVARP